MAIVFIVKKKGNLTMSKSQGEQNDIKTIAFRQNMKSIREFLGMTQSDLSRRSGLTVPAISQIEDGKREPSLRSVIKILDGLGVSFERMIGKP